jgi:type II secretory pathway component PulM
MNFSLDTMSARERRMVLFGALGAVALLLIGVVWPLDSSVSRAQERIGRKQADLVWMRSVGPELANSGPVTTPTTRQESLIVVVDSAAREAGLGSSLTSSEPSGTGGLRVRLEKAQFGLVVGWLARLAEQNGIAVESATIDNAGAPGIVNAGLVLRIK